MKDDVQKWMDRLAKKGPFYLLSEEPWAYPHKLANDEIRTGTAYKVIWRDRNKGDVKIGILHDWMAARYGIQTWAALKGPRPQDMWRGHLVGDGEFAEMLAVWEDRCTLPKFDLSVLKNLSW